MRVRVHKQAAANVHWWVPILLVRLNVTRFISSDMSLSKDLTDQFKEKMQQSHDDMDINFSVMVLGTNFWPLSPPPINFNIPKDILATYERFGRYYNNKHSGRKLTWLWNYSKNELRTNYLNQKYILMTSSYQMAVLVLYNDNDTLSLNEIATATGLNKELLSQVMVPLVKSKILINEENDQYDLNPCKFLLLSFTCS
jgi:cullin 1